ncbi:sugar ABC transporter permease [Clostridiaceae bacterium OttesenSCG-928-D20]|nr:sugar ABC transporter permease [Clostridiaceae bacterium OttesenSCG-928-D20]
MRLRSSNKNRGVSYAKWGYIFLIPFFASFIIFTLIPLGSTFYYSFFEMYRDGLKQVGPNFVGLANYISLLSTDLPKYFGNTVIMWVLGFVPQFFVALLLASWFTNTRLRLKAQSFFKTVIYMPNLIMATAFAMLFFALFSDSGPINNLLVQAGILEKPFRFLASVWGTRGLVSVMNFLMWYGNTTILLMAGILGIDASLYEAARMDGASSFQLFRKITLPLLRPILVYVLITSLIGGLQMFDVPQILTNGNGNPNRSAMTVIMYLNKHLFSKNYGMAGAVSVIMFFVTGLLSIMVFKTVLGNSEEGRRKRHGKK